MKNVLTLAGATLSAAALIGFGAIPGATAPANAWSIDQRTDPPSLNLRFDKGETSGIADGALSFGALCATALKNAWASPVCGAAAARAVVAAKQARAEGKCAYFKVITFPVPVFTWWSSYDC